MNGKLPTEPQGRFQRKARVVRPAPVHKYSRAVGSCRPRHLRDGFDEFAQFSLALLQPLILAFQFCACSLRLSEVEVVINRECDDTTDQSQKTDVVSAVNSPRSAGHAQGAQPSVRSRERNKNQRTNLNPLAREPFLQLGWKCYIRVPVNNEDWFLRGIDPPRWPLLNRHTCIRSDLALLRTQHSPFNLGRVFLVDDNVKLEEVEKFAQFSREDLRQFLRLAARRKSFAETKHRFIASAVAPWRNGDVSADVLLERGSHGRRKKVYPTRQ